MKNTTYKRFTVFIMIMTLMAIDALNILLGFSTAKADTSSRSASSQSTTFSGSFVKPSNFRSVVSVTTNNGTVTHSDSGGAINFTASNGSSYLDYNNVISGQYIPADSKNVSAQTSSHYNSGGYSGSLSQYVYSGSAAQSDYVSGHSSPSYSSGGYSGSLSLSGGSASQRIPLSDSCSNSVLISYDKWGYGSTDGDANACPGSVTLSTTVDGISYSTTGSRSTSNPSSCPYTGPKNGSCTATWVATYSGSVTTQDTRTYSGTVYSADTRVYRYQGTVIKPAVDTREYARMYDYRVTMDYTVHYAPVISSAYASVTAPTKSINVSGNITDANGDNVNLTFKVVNSAGVTVGNYTNAISTRSNYNYSIPTASLASGNYRVLVSGVDNFGYSSSQVMSNTVTVDNTSPVISFSTPATRNTSDVNLTTYFVDTSGFNNKVVTLRNLSKNTDVSTFNPSADTHLTTVSNNGTYSITSSATDAFNNSSTKTSSTFIIDRPAQPLSTSLPIITLNKFQVVDTTNLDTLFNLYEWDGNANVTYRATTNPSGIVSAEIVRKNGVNYLKVTGIKQGGTTISVFAKNTSGVESSPKRFTTSVINRPTTINLFDDYPVTVENNDATGLKIKGTIQDLDKDIVTVTGRFTDSLVVSQSNKVFNLTDLNSLTANWDLNLATTNFKTGVYYNSLNVVANDTFETTVSNTRTAPVVVVKDLARYNKLVDIYSIDIGGVNVYAWNSNNHNALLAAYEAIQKTEENPLNITLIRNAYLLLRDGVIGGVTKPKLASGQVKQQFSENLSDQAFDWLKLNFANATALDYEIIDGSMGVTANNVPIVNDLAHKHYLDNPTNFTKAELVKIVNLSKGIHSENSLNRVDGWLNQVVIKNNFNPGAKLNAAFGKYIELGMMIALYNAPNEFDNSVLQTYFKDELKRSIVIEANNEKHYQLHFKDALQKLGKPTVPLIVSLVNSTNSTIKEYNNVLSQPNKTNVDKLNSAINRLVAGTNYRTSWESGADRLAFIEFIYNLEEKDSTHYEELGLINVSVDANELYTSYINRYVKDTNIVTDDGKPLINKSFSITDTKITISDDFKFAEADVQRVIDLVNALRNYEIDKATVEFVETKIAAFANTNQIFIEAEKEKIELVWNKINNQNRIKKVTNYELSKVGVTDLVTSNNTEYVNNLHTYRPAITTSKWTLSDVQLVVDATNKYMTAERSPNTTNISNAHIAVDTLNKTSIQTQLYKNLETRLEAVAVKYIVSQVNSNTTFSITDVKNTNVLNLDDAYLNDYVMLLTDEIKKLGITGSANLTKAKIQTLFNSYNSNHLKNYKNYILDIANAPKLNALIVSTKALGTNSYTQLFNKYNPMLSPFALQQLFLSPNTTDKLIYSVVGLSDYSPDKLEYYTGFLPLYPSDIIGNGLSAVFTIPLLQNALSAISEFENMINTIESGSTDGDLGSVETVTSFENSRATIDSLILDGDLKDELIGGLNGLLLDKLNQSRFSLTTNALLEYISITDLLESNEALYKNMLMKYKSDVKGNYVTLEEIQKVIDLVNKTKELLDTPLENLTTEDFTKLIEYLETYLNGTMRDAIKGMIDEKLLDYIELNAPNQNVNMEDFENLYLDRISDDSYIQNEYKEYLKDVVNSGELTKDITQLLVDTINSAIEAQREFESTTWDELERKYLDQLGDAIDNLVEGPYKEDILEYYLDAIVKFINAGDNASEIKDIELYADLGADAIEENADTYNEFIQEYVDTNNKTLTQEDIIIYIDSINAYEQLRELIINVSPTISGEELENYKAELIKQETIMNLIKDGVVKDKLNDNIYKLTIETININPAKINEGLAILADLKEYNEKYKDAYVEGLESVKDAIKPKLMSTHDMQLMLDVINLLEDYYESYENKIAPTILREKLDDVLDAIHKLPDSSAKDKYLQKHIDALLNLMLVFPEVMTTEDLVYVGFQGVIHEFEEDYRDFMHMYQVLNFDKMQMIINNTTLLERIQYDLTNDLLNELKNNVKKLEASEYKNKMNAFYDLYYFIRGYELIPNAHYLLNAEELYATFASLSNIYTAENLKESFGITTTNGVQVNYKDFTTAPTNVLERRGNYAVKMLQANNERLVIPFIALESTATKMWANINKLIDDGLYEDRLLNSDIETVFLGLISKTPSTLDLRWFEIVDITVNPKNIIDYMDSISSMIFVVYRELNQDELTNLINFVDKAQLIEERTQPTNTLNQYFNEIKDAAQSVWESNRLEEIKNILGIS